MKGRAACSPDGTTLYRVVRENAETLYAAVDDGAVSMSLPAFVRKEHAAHLEGGLLCQSSRNDEARFRPLSS
jgi:hypothetical protein